jgi:hypothetical protein
LRSLGQFFHDIGNAFGAVRLGISLSPDSASHKSRSRALLCCFAINEKPRVMPTVVDGKREQDRNQQVGKL